MKRLRFFRILLPALLIPFLVMVGFQLRQRAKPWSPPGTRPVEGNSATGIHAVDLDGPEKRFDLNAESYTDTRDGKQRVKGIDPLIVFRDSAPPLKITAEWGDFQGEKPGERFLTVEGGIRIADEESGLSLSLQVLEIEEAVNEARSVGEVHFRAPGYRGTADAVIYPLDNRPPWFQRIRLAGDDGSSLEAARMTLVDGSREVLLQGGVRLEGAKAEFQGESLRLFRDEDGTIRKVLGSEGVSGTARLDREAARFLAEALEIRLDPGGEMRSVRLDRNATLQRGEEALAARMIRLERNSDPSDPAAIWRFQAAGGVFAKGLLEQAPATLQASRMTGTLNEDGRLLRAEAEGSLRFTGPDSLAEADRAEVVLHGARYRILLHSSPALRARIADEQYRVAARTLELISGTEYLAGQGRVEATLLSAGNDRDLRSGGKEGMFGTGEAVHFVAESMESSLDGNQIVFRQAVRGWQGERTLSADTVTLRKETGDLLAEGKVGFRIPLKRTDSLVDADFGYVTGDHLVYTGETRIAFWTGSIHVRQDEGWMEADRLKADLSGESGGLRRLHAEGNVRLEYRVRSEKGIPEPVQGDSDRADYDPATRIVRLFGDQKQATLRKSGKDALTLAGRILRYHLENGAIEVEKGVSGTSTIRTSGRDEKGSHDRSGD